MVHFHMRLGRIAWLIALAAGSYPLLAQETDEIGMDRLLRSTVNGVSQQAGEVTQQAVETPTILADPRVELLPSGAVMLNAVDVPLSTVLQVLSVQSKRNIITSPNVTGTVTASLQDVTFEEALDAILVANNAGYRVDGKFIYIYTADELVGIIEAENPPVARVFHLNYITAEDVEPAITPLLSPIGQVSISIPPETGIATGRDSAGGASLAGSDYVVVYDRPANLDAIGQMLRELDTRPRQVLVEATILSASLTDDNALGVDFTVVGGVNLEMLGSTSQAVQQISVGQLPQDRFTKFNSNVTTDLTNNIPDGGMTVGIIKDHVAVFIRALEQVTDTVVLANPKVLALNKQKGQVIVGRRDGYITTTVTEVQAIQTVEFLETGTQLIFRPYIANDGFIRMELHPEDSTGGLTAANLPFERTTEVTTNVIIKDGQTILIGGLFREDDNNSRAQVPLLGDIPVVGSVFQSRTDGVNRQEVIILLTVHVVKDFDAYSKESWEEAQNVERLRVGVRDGQMWHSRERIANSLYKTALEHYTDGDFDGASWYARMSLHNSPQFLPSIELLEDIRGERAWQDDGSATRGFIQRVIMQEEGIVEPLFGRPVPPFIPPNQDQVQGPAGFGDPPVDGTETDDAQG